MRKFIWAIVIIAIVVIIFLISNNSFSKKSVDASKPIKIGAALSLSGIAVQDGESIKNGLEMARTDLKKQGIDVEIIYQDDKTDSKETVSVINLLGAQGVDAIIGPTWSFLADAGVPVADNLKIVTVMPANTSEYVGARSSYAFFTTSKVATLSDALTKWLKNSGKKKVAIISSKGAWYETVDKAVEKSVIEAGGEVVFKDTLPLGDAATAMSTVVTKLKTSKPDIIFAEIDDDQGIITMFQKFRTFGINSTIMSVTTSLGRVLSSGAIKIKPENDFYVVAPATSKDFEAKYIATYGSEMKPYADRAYDSLMLVVNAIKNKGDAPLAEYLKTHEYNGYLETYKFDQNNDIMSGEWLVKKI